MFMVETKAKVAGYMRWSVYDRNGQRIPVKTQDGRTLWGGHLQKNLITDYGMDKMADNPPDQAQGWLGHAFGQSWNLRRYIRLGTGSTEPAFEDANLNNQVQSTESSGSFSGSGTAGEQVGDDFIVKRRVTRLATMSQNRNLTEYGFSHEATGDNVSIRELFRDENGDPITITVLEGNSIRVDHWFHTTVSIAREMQTLTIEEYDAANTLIDTHQISVETGILTRASSASDLQRRANDLARAMVALGLGTDTNTISQRAFYWTNLNPSMPAPFDSAGLNGPNGDIDVGDINISRPAYVPGSHERYLYVTVLEGSMNTTFTGFFFRRNNSGSTDSNHGGGLMIAFRNDDTFTKENTHTLRFGYKTSWARA